jgi:hypothetical protein
VFPNQETGQFIGFTDSSPFTSVIISPVSDPGTGEGRCGDSSTCPYTVDTLVYGDAAALVPEPSVWAMMLAGFAGLGAVALRRRRKIKLALPEGAPKWLPGSGPAAPARGVVVARR